MMRWYKKLYLGDSIRHEKFVRYKMMYSDKCNNYYCITLPIGKGCLLDIYKVSLLKNKLIDNSCFTIVGLASNKKEAMHVVRDIIEEVYRDTHKFNVGEFLGLTG